MIYEKQKEIKFEEFNDFKMLEHSEKVNTSESVNLDVYRNGEVEGEFSKSNLLMRLTENIIASYLI